MLKKLSDLELNTIDSLFIKNMKMSVNAMQNIEELLEMIVKDNSYVMSKYQDKLLNSRTKNWISKIEKLSKEQPTFLA